MARDAERPSRAEIENFQLDADPLKIRYVLVLDSAGPESFTVFQGFAPGWRHLGWALHALSLLPADVLESDAPIDPLISQRMGGARELGWLPLGIDTLELFAPRQLGFFVVVFTGDIDVARRIEAWRERHSHPVLHVSNTEVGLHPRQFDEAALIAFCLQTLREHGAALDTSRLEHADQALSRWSPRKTEPIDLIAHRHNVVVPNILTLTRAARELREGDGWMGTSEAEYDDVILSTSRVILKARERAGLLPINRLTLLHPEVYLVEPALFRPAYDRLGRGPLSKAGRDAVRMLQTQAGFLNPTTEDALTRMMESPEAAFIMSERVAELETFTYGVALAAAQTCSATVRLSPGVNRVFPALTAFANNVRSPKAEARRKAGRLFDFVQCQLVEAVGSTRHAFIESEVSGPIKIISDAPVEWLPIRGLPLHLRHQVSRLNATPGNLLMGELARNRPVTVPPEAVQHVLVVSSFKKGDPIAPLLRGAIEASRNRWDGKVAVAYREASTIDEFKAALNEFDGAILVFDGHGTGGGEDGVGKLVIGSTPLDVWSLRGEVRCPPIVILAACDTHTIDAATHATVGNGFLAIGAQAVVATLLPVGGVGSATFIARLMHRLADFIPAALDAHKRVLSWAEVVTGMQRMLLASEVLDALVSRPDKPGSPRMTLQMQANVDINSGEDDWFERLTANIAGHLGEAIDQVQERVHGVIATSEAIRYMQLGHPENILIDDGRIRRRIFAERGLNEDGKPQTP